MLCSSVVAAAFFQLAFVWWMGTADSSSSGSSSSLEQSTAASDDQTEVLMDCLHSFSLEETGSRDAAASKPASNKRSVESTVTSEDADEQRRSLEEYITSGLADRIAEERDGIVAQRAGKKWSSFRQSKERASDTKTRKRLSMPWSSLRMPRKDRLSPAMPSSAEPIVCKEKPQEEKSNKTRVRRPRWFMFTLRGRGRKHRSAATDSEEPKTSEKAAAADSKGDEEGSKRGKSQKKEEDSEDKPESSKSSTDVKDPPPSTPRTIRWKRQVRNSIRPALKWSPSKTPTRETSDMLVEAMLDCNGDGNTSTILTDSNTSSASASSSSESSEHQTSTRTTTTATVASSEGNHSDAILKTNSVVPTRQRETVKADSSESDDDKDEKGAHTVDGITPISSWSGQSAPSADSFEPQLPSPYTLGGIDLTTPRQFKLRVPKNEVSEQWA